MTAPRYTDNRVEVAVFGVTHAFQLRVRGLAEVQARTDRPITDLNDQIAEARYDAALVAEIAPPILRAGLTGAGLDIAAADALVHRFVDGLPLVDLHRLVALVWAAGLVGVEPKASPGKTKARRALTSLRRMLSSLSTSIWGRMKSTI